MPRDGDNDLCCTDFNKPGEERVRYHENLPVWNGACFQHGLCIPTLLTPKLMPSSTLRLLEWDRENRQKSWLGAIHFYYALEFTALKSRPANINGYTIGICISYILVTLLGTWWHGTHCNSLSPGMRIRWDISRLRTYDAFSRSA